MPRSPLTETFKRVTGMIDYVRENLDDQEYDLFLDLINPEPEAKVIEKSKPIRRKKIEHCEVCDYTRRALVHKDESVKDYHEFVSSKSSLSTKSKRAKSIGEAIHKTPRVRMDDDDSNDDRGLCVVGIDSKGMTCGESADHNSHHLATHPDYHEFVEGKSHALAAGEGS